MIRYITFALFVMQQYVFSILSCNIIVHCAPWVIDNSNFRRVIDQKNAIFPFTNSISTLWKRCSRVRSNLKIYRKHDTATKKQ